MVGRMKDDIKILFYWVVAIFVVVCFATGWPFLDHSKMDPYFAPTTRPLLEPDTVSALQTNGVRVPARVQPELAVAPSTTVEQFFDITVVSNENASDSSASKVPSSSTTAPSAEVEASKVSHGTQHSCWLESGAPVCVGFDYYGETDVSPNFVNVKQVEAGDARTCVLDGDGVVYCWGFRTGENATSSMSPVRVPLPGPATLVSAGGGQECAAVQVSGGEQIWCWGEGYDTGAGYSGKVFADTQKPVMMWYGKHVHSIDVGYRSATAHVGLFDGTCTYIYWGDGESWPVVRTG